MKNKIETIGFTKLIFVPLIIIGASIVIGNFINQDIASYISEIEYTGITFILVILAIIISIKFGSVGTHGKAWIFFVIFSISLFIAELLWSIYEKILEIEPYPSLADVFYILAYPMLFLFSIFYLKSVKSAITKKMIYGSMLIAIVISVPIIYQSVTMEFENESKFFEIILAAIYPILDGIVLAPALVGSVLFLKGRVNFLWTLIILGILSLVAADYAYWFSVLDDTYYVGHPIDILFIWSYTLFSFGVYHHWKIFSVSTKQIDKSE